MRSMGDTGRMNLERPELAVLTAYLDDLGRELRGPRRVKADLLAEARGSLIDAVSALQARGVPTDEAQRQAVAAFGPVARIAPDYQTELAVAQGRRTGLLIFSVFFAQGFLWTDAQDSWAITAIKWSGSLVILLAVVTLIASRRAGRRFGVLTGIFGYAVVALFTAMGIVLTAVLNGAHFLELNALPRTAASLLLPLVWVALSARRSIRAAA
jgi:hypothetical protein